MKFHLVDKIVSIELPGGGPGGRRIGGRIVTTKALSLAEEYLADHFPAFPVLPGVLMLEAMVQSAAWLIRAEQNFAKSIIVLSCARNVRYASFVVPGDILRCELEAVELSDSAARFKSAAFVGDRQTVSARLELRCFNLAERHGYLGRADEAIVAQLKQQFKLIGGQAASTESAKA